MRLEGLLSPSVAYLGAEIGVHRGQRAVCFLKALPLLTLIMVDHWSFRGEEVDPQLAKLGISHGPQNYDKAIKATEFARDRRIVVPLSSLDAVEFIADESLDFVFLDADHRYAAVSADLKAWFPKIKGGGFLAGHDLIEKQSYPDWKVKEAVENFGRLYVTVGGDYFVIWK